MTNNCPKEEITCTTDYQEVVLTSEKEPKKTRIEVGIRPSGLIHLGNIATASLAATLAKDIGSHISELRVTICDLDMPNRTDWQFSKKGYVKFFKDLPSPEVGYQNLLEYSTIQMEDFFCGLAEHLGIEAYFAKMSDVQKTPEFREGLEKVLEDEKLMKYLFPRTKKNEVHVTPLCKKCHTGTFTPGPLLKNGVIHTICKNPECKVERYEAPLKSTQIKIAPHYLIDPLRDGVLEEKTDVHVFGGDYLEPHAENRVPKINKIKAVTMKASEGYHPFYVIAPTLYAKDGNKMSKSEENGLTLENLRRHLGEKEYIPRIAEFVDHLVRKRFKHVDFNVVEEQLLSRKFK